MLGSGGNPDHDDSIRIITKALDAGINVIGRCGRGCGSACESP
jgi:hypothetical protein